MCVCNAHQVHILRELSHVVGSIVLSLYMKKLRLRRFHDLHQISTLS